MKNPSSDYTISHYFPIANKSSRFVIVDNRKKYQERFVFLSNISIHWKNATHIFICRISLSVCVCVCVNVFCSQTEVNTVCRAMHQSKVMLEELGGRRGSRDIHTGWTNENLIVSDAHVELKAVGLKYYNI